MERAILEMEKIKKAEEIYAKRKNLNDEEELIKKPKSLYKFLFQGLILINIAIIIVAVQNRDYIFTKNFIEQVNSYNVSLKEKIENMFSVNEKTSENGKKDAPKSENTNPQNVEQNVDNSIENQENNDMPNEENTDNKASLVENNEPEAKELSQMEKDVISIKEKYSLILPLSGTKTSGFGDRESSNSKVTPHHTGVDIAANKGTTINSSITGTVTQVSSEGNYGKHLKIESDNLCILYAHCSKIYVSEGENVTQGQPVAEVGATRKCYRSTFTF